MADLLIRILATWRIAYMLVDRDEEGPFGVLTRLRHKVGVRVRSDNTAYVVAPEKRPWQAEIGKLFLCIWCMSPWVGAIVSVLPQWMLLPFALSGGALIVHKQAKRG